ncbi:MAG: LysR family transcriptional regulator [Rhodospirillaceae bacterium]|nr:LysR family transcriptional regulator [Rhodospirillaceae bacterium]
MRRIPDFEAWAIFAKVAYMGSFSRAAEDLGLSKATVSKAITRLEEMLLTPLFHRTSRRLSLTESGRLAVERAERILADGLALEADVGARSLAPSGLVRMAAPMSFGIAHLAPALPDFFALYPDIQIELNFSDSQIDLVSDNYDLALRIATLVDSSLIARRLCEVRILLVGSPGYFRQHGYPQHPQDLGAHQALFYTLGRSRDAWQFFHAEQGDYTVTVRSPLRVNNADALMPALHAGLGLALQPEFLVWRDLATGMLEVALPEWAPRPISLNLVTPPSGIRPARVEVLIDFLTRRFAKAPWAWDGKTGSMRASA